MNQLKDSLMTGRIITVFKDRYLIDDHHSVITSEVSGRFRFTHDEKSDYPQIGDIVKFHEADAQFAIIESIEERRNTLSRLDVGQNGGRHVLACNIDLCFICLSLNGDYNEKKLRNFLSLTYKEGLQTIILLTKADLCSDTNAYIERTKAITDNEIVTCSIYDSKSLEQLRAIMAHKTSVIIGSSGVGKSSLINELMGFEHFKTQTIRMSDAQGRHTTVNRELIDLGDQTYVIDTPGIRIVHSYFVDEEAFEDILSLAEKCQFKNCQHHREPNCYVRYALESGVLSYDRFEQYQKALKLNAYNQRREVEKERILERQKRNHH